MKKLWILLFALCFTACDDGDLTLEQLNFDDQPVQTPCGGLLVYKLSAGRTEALLLQLNGQTSSIFTTLTENGAPRLFDVGGNNRIVYRVFDDQVSNNYFCQSIPPASPLVIEEWTGSGGTIQIATTRVQDDNDGIPADEEGAVRNEDGTLNFEASRDTDGDGLPDYMDFDDDGDNVPTSAEIVVNSGTITFTDSDGDGIPNYLDNDDDNDGVLTINEDINGDNNPANDVQPGNTEPNYLIASLNTPTTLPVSRRAHSFENTFENVIDIINGFQLQNGSEEIKFDVSSYPFGTYTVPVTVNNQ